VVDLAHARHALGRGERPLAQSRLVVLRLDVDDDVALRQGTLNRGLDRISRSVTLADHRSGRHADHDVREVAAGGLAPSQPAELDRWLEPTGRLARPLLCG